MRGQKLLPLILSLLSLAATVRSQDGRSVAMGGVGTALEWGPESVVWNPASLALTARPQGIAIALGASGYDGHNLEGASLDHTDLVAAQSGLGEVRHRQTYHGLIAGQVQSFGGGVLLDHEVDRNLTSPTASFLHNRSANALAASAYPLDLKESDSQVETLGLSYGKPFPLGQASAAVGSTLKIHQGARFRQTHLSGVFQLGQPNGVSGNRWTSDSGSGFSVDLGVLVKPTPNLQAGFVWENLKSTFKWKTQREALALDSATGAEVVAPAAGEELDAPMTRATRIGIALASPDKSSTLATDAHHARGKTQWRFGWERYWVEKDFALRLGTYKDPVSDRRLWTGGVAYLGKRLQVQLGVAGDRWPVVQDSSAFEGGLNLGVML
jgi:hypothetical protein